MILIFLLLLLTSNGLTIRPDSSIIYSRIGIIIMFYSITSAIVSLHITYLHKGIGLYGGFFSVTNISHIFQIFIFFICGIILMLTAFYPRKKYKGDKSSFVKILITKRTQYINIINKMSEQFTIIEYALIILFIITGATFLVSSSDLSSMYLCLELQSFSIYILSSIHRNSELSTGSALTYFLLGGLSSCFILLGIALMYANTGMTNTDSIYCMISYIENYYYHYSWYTNKYMFFSFLLVSIGFLFKIAAAPLHWWSPDVYDGVPTIITTSISILGKISILIILMEFVNYTTVLLNSTVQAYSWITSLSVSCFLSLIIGSIFGLSQKRIKRLLAYSTISHVGFILLALVVHNAESSQAFLFYILQYNLTNLNVFLIVLAIGFSLYLYFTNVSDTNYNLYEKNNSPIQLISQLKGYFFINPLLTLCLAITMFSFIGLPPLSGFFAKQMVLTSALDNHKTFLVLTAILTSAISAVYYLVIIKTLYFDNLIYKRSYLYIDVSLSNYLSINISMFTLLILIFIAISGESVNICNLLSLMDYT